MEISCNFEGLPLVDDLIQALDLAENFFHNIATVIHILLTMPVATASSERSFKCLIKTSKISKEINGFRKAE